MPRHARRRTLAPGIYQDGNSIEIRVTKHGTRHAKYLPPDTTLDEAKAARRRLAASLDEPQPGRHTLAADAARYLTLQRHRASYRSLRAILRHWCDRVGPLGRHRITPQDVLSARVAWLEAGAAPRTVNHRIAVLRHLYRLLDGTRAKTPCDDIPDLPVPKTPIQRIPDALILAVDRELAAREQRGLLLDAKTRARFRVLVTTGRRPSEVMRAQPADVNLPERVWVVRDGKGGWSPGLYLNDDMLAAWRLFVEAKAWGRYSTSALAKTLRSAGWPSGLRVYQVRHTTWIMAVERGADMADVQIGAGHTNLRTTRQYTGIRASRMQQLSERLDGRFQGFGGAEDGEAS